jgi:hypothetical protein
MSDELQEVQEQQPAAEEAIDSSLEETAEEPGAEAEPGAEGEEGGAPDPDATEPADPGTEAEDVSTEETEES